MDGVDMPSDESELPPELSFLIYVDAIRFPEQYLRSPFSEFTSVLQAKQDGKGLYKDSFNNNECYQLGEDLQQLLKKANEGAQVPVFCVKSRFYDEKRNRMFL